MVLSLRIFQFAQLLILIDAGRIVPDACSPVKIECVGEGQTCLGDQSSSSNICDGSDFSICRICGNEDLSCHAGLCMKKIGSKNDLCSMQNYHVACAGDLECRSGRCQEPAESPEDKQLGRGEKCDIYDDLCIDTLMCDINQKCSAPVCKRPAGSDERCKSGVQYKLLEKNYCEDQGCEWVGIDSDFIIDDSTRLSTCSVSNDCHFGEYCNSGVCLPAVEIGKRLYAPCVSKNSIGNDQCGSGFICTDKNRFESEPDRKALVCKWAVGPFDKVEGEKCSSSNDCGRDMLCTSQTCSKAYTVHTGQGCYDSGECGTGMTCSCPEFGDENGGRKRCTVSSGYQTHNKQIDDFNNIYKPYISCITKNKCKLPRCIQKNCEDLRTKWSERNVASGMCKAKSGNDAYIQAASYEGVPGRSESGLDALVKKGTDWEIVGIFFIIMCLICASVGGILFKNGRNVEGGQTSVT